MVPPASASTSRSCSSRLSISGSQPAFAAIREALRLGAIGFDAIKHLLLCRIERRPPRLDLDVYP